MRFVLVVLFSVLLAAQSVAAPLLTQTDAALAEGQPPLTRGTVNDVESFFEWLFEAQFDAGRRRELESALVAIWRSNDRKEIAAVGEILQVSAKLAGISEEKRNEVKAAMLPEVVKSLRAEPGDFSRLLLSVYESGLAGAGTDTDAGAAGAAEAGALQGSWRSTEMGMIRFC
jgi:hypothetical protein